MRCRYSILIIVPFFLSDRRRSITMDFWSHLVLPLTLVFSVLYMSITLADGRPLHASRNPYMSRSFTTSSVTSSAKSSPLLSSPSYASTTLNSRKRTGRRNNKFLAEWATAKRPFKRRKKNKNKKKQKPQNSPITFIKLPATPYINTGKVIIEKSRGGRFLWSRN